MNARADARMDAPVLADWIGSEAFATDTLTVRDAQRLAATLHRADDRLLAWQPAPALWHWCCFAAAVDGRALDVDGHPVRGDFLPPVPLPRRMWAGGDVVIHRPPRIGERLQRASTVIDVREKTGRSGPLVFVTVQHEVRTSRGVPCISERQDIVYRAPAAAAAAAPGTAAPAPHEAHWQETVCPDAVMLFRYSALTFNGHRIHYDRDHASGVEGYPGLVVHGPLLATLLAGALQRRIGGRALARFAFRALGPAFAGQALRLCGRDEADGESSLWILDPRDQLIMTATARA